MRTKYKEFVDLNNKAAILNGKYYTIIWYNWHYILALYRYVILPFGQNPLPALTLSRKYRYIRKFVCNMLVNLFSPGYVRNCPQLPNILVAFPIVTMEDAACERIAIRRLPANGPLTRYAKLQVAPGTFSPLPRVSDRFPARITWAFVTVSGQWASAWPLSDKKLMGFLSDSGHMPG